MRLKAEEIAGMLALLLFGTGLGCILAGSVLLWIFFGGH